MVTPNPEASIEKIERTLKSRINANSIPLTIIAISEEGQLLGCGNLTASDMKTRTELSPWMGGVFVAPEFRGQGVASAISNKIKEEASRLQIPTIYLFTKDKAHLYSRLGWTALSTENYNGIEVTVMDLKVTK